MKKELSACSIGYFHGHCMHTHGVGVVDEQSWYYSNCDESEVKPDVLYKVWFTCHDASDPADLSSTYCVFYYEEVPQNIIEMKKKVDEYWKSNQPLSKSK